MAFTTAKQIDGARAGSMLLASAQVANSGLLYTLSRSLTAAGVARATTVTKVKTVNTLTYTVLGQFYSKGATDNFWTLSGTTVAASSWQKYLLLIDTAGAASVQEGVQSKVDAASVVWTNISNVSPWDAFLTVCGSTKCIVGVLTVATSSAGTFIPGTTNLNAAQVTDTYIDGVDGTLIPLVANSIGTVYGNA